MKSNAISWPFHGHFMAISCHYTHLSSSLVTARVPQQVDLHTLCEARMRLRPAVG